MADFTGGSIDLSIANVFDNVILGDGAVMNFINEGTGGESGKPIKVLGVFTTHLNSDINLRDGVNLSAGNVTVSGITRSLTQPAITLKSPGNGGTAGSSNATNGAGGRGGNGGRTGGGATGSNSACGKAGGSGGSYPSGSGGSGTSGTSSCLGGGGGGGGASNAEPGNSTEMIAFEVVGDIDVKGRINGNGGDATGVAGNGGGGGGGYTSGGLYGGGGGGGGGGAGASGGAAGNLFLYYFGSATETATKNLSGGVGVDGGNGGSGGSSSYYPGAPGGHGQNGDTGDSGVLELIDAKSPPILTTDSISDVFSRQLIIHGETIFNGGATITERGFCWSTSSNPTTADDKIVISGTIGEYQGDLTSLLPDTIYHVRAYAINSEGTGYGEDFEFKTHKSFIPAINTGN